MDSLSRKFSPAPAILSTYLAQAKYGESELSNLCKLDDQNDAKKTTFAWNYFSSNANADDYKKVAPSKLTRIFTMTLPGAILAVARIVYDVFFCIYKLLSSSPSASQNLKRLGFCLGRDVAQLASYMALPFIDRALPWIAHHEVQRALLLQDTPERIQQHLTFELAMNGNEEAFHAFEKLYEGRQNDFGALIFSTLYPNSIPKTENLKKILNMKPAFLLGDFDAEFWTQGNNFRNISMMALYKILDDDLLFNILDKLSENKKYDEFITLFSNSKYFSEYKEVGKDLDNGKLSNTFYKLFESLKKNTILQKRLLKSSLSIL